MAENKYLILHSMFGNITNSFGITKRKIWYFDQLKKPNPTINFVEFEFKTENFESTVAITARNNTPS